MKSFWSSPASLLLISPSMRSIRAFWAFSSIDALFISKADIDDGNVGGIDVLVARRALKCSQDTKGLAPVSSDGVGVCQVGGSRRLKIVLRLFESCPQCVMRLLILSCLQVSEAYLALRLREMRVQFEGRCDREQLPCRIGVGGTPTTPPAC